MSMSNVYFVYSSLILDISLILKLSNHTYESSLSARGAAINAGKVSVFICIRVIPLVTLSCPRSR